MIAGNPPGLYALFRQQADSLSETVAVRGLNAVDLTYRGFIAQTERVIDMLAAQGIGRGDRVLIQLPNGPEALVMMQGVAAGAVAVMMDPRAGAVEMDYFLGFIRPAAIVLQQGVETSGRALAAQHGVRIIDIIPTPQSGAGTFAFAGPKPSLVGAPTLNGPDDLAMLITTSGTTSLPKLVPKTQRNLAEGVAIFTTIQDQVIHQLLPFRVLCYVPLHLFFGITLASVGLATGGEVTCLPGLDTQRFYEWLDVYQPTFMAGTSPVYEQLLPLAREHADVLARHHLRYVQAGGSANPAAIFERMLQVFAVPAVKLYAMTEVDLIASLVLRPERVDRIETDGQVVDAETIRVMGHDGRFTPPGEVGEIVVKHPSFTGYWNNPEANREAFIDGWFRTGDAGSIDANGYLTLTGRIKEVINSGGAKVSPLEVETVLKQHPQVRDAVVFGLKNADVGETVAAAVVGTVSERELRRFAAGRLPFFKVPTRIFSVDVIPVGVSGKVQRNRLPELLGLE